MASEAFGGEEKGNENMDNNMGFSKNMKEKNRNAYLLFYDRVKYYDEEGKVLDKLID